MKAQLDQLNVIDVDGHYFGGQPTLKDLEVAKSNGMTAIINMRAPGEADFAQQEDWAKENGIAYYHLPILNENGLNDDSMTKSIDIIKKHSNQRVFVHCASGNRIGMWYANYQIRANGMSANEAREKSWDYGVTNPQMLSLINE